MYRMALMQRSDLETQILDDCSCRASRHNQPSSIDIFRPFNGPPIKVSRPVVVIASGEDLEHNQESDLADDVSVSDNPPRVPRMYRVILHNDDYTTMEFVIWVLTEYFSKSEAEANQIMLNVHKQGKGLCGVFTFEIAETKIHLVTESARENDYPLRCTMEPEGESEA